MDKTNKIIIFILLVNIILIGICLYQIKGKSTECINDPLIYGAKLLSESNNGEFSCNCYILPGEGEPSYISPKIFFNSQGIKVEYETPKNIYRQEVNFSFLNESLNIS